MLEARGRGGDQIDLIGPDARISQRPAQRGGQAAAVGAGAGRLLRLVRVVGGAEADDLAVDPRPAPLRVLERLDNHQPAALGRRRAVAIGREGPAGMRGVVVAAAESPGEALAHQGHGVHLALGPAADAHVRHAAGDRPAGLADGQMAGRLGAGDGVAGPLGVVDDRDVAGEHVGQELQQPQRGEVVHALGAPLADVEDAIDGGAGQRLGQLGQIGADQAGADVGPEAGRVEVRLPRHVAAIDQTAGAQVGIERGLMAGGDGQHDVAGHDLAGLAIALGHVVGQLHAVDLTANLRVEPRRVEALDPPDAAAAFEQGVPERLGPDADGADGPESGDDHAAAVHRLTLVSPSRRKVSSIERN